jgi:hypothetical protein
MIDSLKAKPVDAPAQSDEEEEDHIDDTTNLSIDQRLFQTSIRATRELNHLNQSDSSLAEEIQKNYAKQVSLVQTEAKLRYDDMFIQAKGPPARVEFEIDDEDPENPDDDLA